MKGRGHSFSVVRYTCTIHSMSSRLFHWDSVDFKHVLHAKKLLRHRHNAIRIPSVETSNPIILFAIRRCWSCIFTTPLPMTHKSDGIIEPRLNTLSWCNRHFCKAARLHRIRWSLHRERNSFHLNGGEVRTEAGTPFSPKNLTPLPHTTTPST